MGMSGTDKPVLFLIMNSDYATALMGVYRMLGMVVKVASKAITGLVVAMCMVQHVVAMPHTETTWLLQDDFTRSGATTINQNHQAYERSGQSSSSETAYKNLSVTHQGQTDNLNIKTHLTVNYLNSPDQVADNDQAMKINAFYLDASSSGKTVSSRLGRQSFDLAGSSYAIDGLALDYRLGKRQRIKLLAGYPQTESTAIEMDTDTAVYGISAESERIARYWETDIYMLEQRTDGLVGDQFYGSRLSYLHPKHNALLRVNFDPDLHELQSGSFAYNWKPGGAQSMKLALDYRKPGTQAGQAVPALEELLKTMNEEQLKSLEHDESAAFRSAAFAWSKSLAHNLQLNGELSVSSLARASIIGELESESYYLYGLQLKGSNFIRRKDEASLSLRYFEHDTTNRLSLFFNNLMPIKPYWHAGVQLEAYWQENEDESRILGVGPLFKLQYNQKDKSRLDFELGMVRSENQGHSAADITDINDIYMSITHSKRLW
jgi:hypothetical protein